MNKNNIVTCQKCKHKQKLIRGKSIFKDNIYQDISGLFTICEECGNIFNVEYYTKVV